MLRQTTQQIKVGWLHLNGPTQPNTWSVRKMSCGGGEGQGAWQGGERAHEGGWDWVGLNAPLDFLAFSKLPQHITAEQSTTSWLAWPISVCARVGVRPNLSNPMSNHS